MILLTQGQKTPGGPGSEFGWITGMTHPTSSPGDVAPSLFTRIDHVGVAVANLDEAKAFYEQTYGMTVAH